MTRQLTHLVFQLDGFLPLLLSKYRPSFIDRGRILRPGSLITLLNCHRVVKHHRDGTGRSVGMLGLCGRGRLLVRRLSKCAEAIRPFNRHVAKPEVSISIPISIYLSLSLSISICIYISLVSLIYRPHIHHASTHALTDIYVYIYTLR